GRRLPDPPQDARADAAASGGTRPRLRRSRHERALLEGGVNRRLGGPVPRVPRRPGGARPRGTAAAGSPLLPAGEALVDPAEGGTPAEGGRSRGRRREEQRPAWPLFL
ncbi:unnamed protein product, partial [Urochloa humidicola]